VVVDREAGSSLCSEWKKEEPVLGKALGADSRGRRWVQISYRGGESRGGFLTLLGMEARRASAREALGADGLGRPRQPIVGGGEL